jgi:hypothetical protein
MTGEDPGDAVVALDAGDNPATYGNWLFEKNCWGADSPYVYQFCGEVATWEPVWLRWKVGVAMAGIAA